MELTEYSGIFTLPNFVTSKFKFQLGNESLSGSGFFSNDDSQKPELVSSLFCPHDKSLTS